MQYALLFYNPPHTELPESERDPSIGEMLEAMGAWQKELEEAGVYRTGLRLAPVDAATSLRSEGATLRVLDGPFAETKEILGGLVLIECASPEQALGFAKRCPISRIGTVELRPEWGAGG